MNRKIARLVSSTGLVELFIITAFAVVPLFISFPYRVNIFLSWEGAYRMSNGELPFRDFGTPLGGMYWAIPAIFFKLLGPQLITLVKAQAFINIISGLAFRSILKSFGVMPSLRLAGVLLYCLSFSFFNFWPWYNHSVIVFEFIALAFLFYGLLQEQRTGYRICWFVLAGLFTCFAFFTKQDAGAMAFLLGLLFTGYYLLAERKWLPVIVYAGSFIIFLTVIILLLQPYGFGYWFNHGQAPHSARVSLSEIAEEFFASSQWIKLYLFFIFFLLVLRFPRLKDLWRDKREMLFLLLVTGILGEAAVFQVTSYTPPDNNIFFHSFATVYILYSIIRLAPSFANGKKIVGAALAGILLCWSGVYWKYIHRVLDRVFPAEEQAVISPTGENVVNRKTYMIDLKEKDTTEVAMEQWVYSPLKSFSKIYMPPATVEGINRLMSMELIKERKNLKVLNMTELTPLAVELPYQLERGSHYPLWYHLGVGMFNKQAEMFEQRIAKEEYDLVLFEYIPSLNNFYPFRVRNSLLENYQLADSFEAPRRGDTRGKIEVYIKPASGQP